MKLLLNYNVRCVATVQILYEQNSNFWQVFILKFNINKEPILLILFQEFKIFFIDIDINF